MFAGSLRRSSQLTPTIPVGLTESHGMLLPPNVPPRRPQSQQSQSGNGWRRTVHLGQASVCNWAGVAGTNRFIRLDLVSVARQSRIIARPRAVEPRPAEVFLSLHHKLKA